MNEAERTEQLIVTTLRVAGDWMTQAQIARATGLPRSRVLSYTLSMATDGTIQRRLVDDDRTEQFRARHESGVPCAATDTGTGRRDTDGGEAAASHAGHYQDEHATDGHWPAWTLLPGTETYLIGCECGQRPQKRAQRMSMQHVWHQAHRRKLRLQPVEYQCPEEDHHQAGALSTGRFVQVRGHVWRDGAWVKESTR